ncbi:MAG TPA: transglycosylase SLT domain-containing protein [Ktedonobacterales bacterium]|nr:transglycosylase SLT domain-containing protein [Ktedonobacterales bacterium]
MRERRSIGQRLSGARSRLVPAGCAVALLAVTVALFTGVIIPNTSALFGSSTGASAQATNTPSGPSVGLTYQLILPTAPATALKIARTPELPQDALFATLGKAKAQNTCEVATPPATTPTTEATASDATATVEATTTENPQPTATATEAPTPTATIGFGATTATPSSNCQSCPVYMGNNPDQTTIAAALEAAALKYGLPTNLLKAVAWQESRWHVDVLSCDGGIGLMQIQYYTYPWLNSVVEPACDLAATNDDPYTLEGNADLGAKYLKWLSCFYSYWGDNGGASLTSPGAYTIAAYYQQAGLQYPDSLNADGSTNPDSYCAAVYNDPNHLEYAALPSTISDVWSCPYSATTGDNTLLDMVLSAYNEGAGYTDQYGIQNPWYVSGVEGWIPQFASSALPTPS